MKAAAEREHEVAGRNGQSSGPSDSGLIELPDMMACEEAELLISKRLDGELPSEDIPRLDAHLADCGNCRETLDAWQDHSKSLDESLDSLWTKPLEPAPAAEPTRAQMLAEKTLRTTVVRRAVSKPQKSRNCMWVPLGMAASQALAFVLLTVYFVFFQPKAEAPQAMLPAPDPTAPIGRVKLDAPPEPPLKLTPLETTQNTAAAPVAPPAVPQHKTFEQRYADDWPTTQPWDGIEPRVPQNVVMAAFDGEPLELIDNVSATFTIELKDGSTQRGRLRLLGDPFSGRAVVRIIDEIGLSLEVAQRDVDTLVDPALKPVVQRFLEACSNPDLRPRMLKTPTEAR